MLSVDTVAKMLDKSHLRLTRSHEYQVKINGNFYLTACLIRCPETLSPFCVYSLVHILA
ncbi:unnamed protein product [Schistosoma mattheei]|uniref:Uncharacterized protein n=1 Tax=Schistosoma mattheei TaxID=31246 RepID=A0A3P8G356_9TREM|nr:unnamed protein product [Schistosoma mattheei]